MGSQYVPRADAGWPDRLDRYYAGEGTAGERAAVDAYLAEHPDVVRFFDALRGELTGLDAPARDDSAALHRIKSSMSCTAPAGNVPGVSITPEIGSRARPQESWMRFGARSALRHVPSQWNVRWAQQLLVGVAATIVAGIGVFAVSQFDLLPQQHRRPIVYVTQPGQRAEIELGDGTHVTLNVASRIDVPDGFGRTARTVHLTGEAYFNVAHSSGAPFIVDAGRTRATVLGTQFGVRAYRGGDVQVAVRNGKVAVGRAVLLAGDIVRVAPAGVMTIASRQDLTAALGFVTGKLILNNIPLRAAIPDLNRWYDVDIRLGDPGLGDKPIEAALGSGSRGELREILQVIFNVRVIQEGRMLTLYSR